MLCRLFFQIYIKIKTDITEIDIAEASRRADNPQIRNRPHKMTQRSKR